MGIINLLTIPLANAITYHCFSTQTEATQAAREHFEAGGNTALNTCGTSTIAGTPPEYNLTSCVRPRYATDHIYGVCTDPNASTETLQCESDVVKQILDEWALYENNIVAETIFAVSPDQEGNIILTDYSTTTCVNTGVKTVQEDQNSPNVFCDIERAYTQSLTEDNSVSQLTSITSITDNFNGGLECTGAEVLVTQNDTTVTLVPTNEVTETSTDSETGETVTTTQESYQTTEYDPDTNTTLTCSTTVTTTTTDDGLGGSSVSDSTSENCSRTEGDSTEEGRGSGTNIVVNQDGTTTVTSNNGGTTTSNTPTVTAEIEGLGELIEEMEGLCDDPNGCEDFAEIIESYDDAVTQSSISASGSTLTDAVNNLETGLTGTTAEELVTGIGAVSDGVSDGFGVFTSGTCQSMIIPFAQGDAVFTCNDTEPIRIVVLLMSWLYLIIHIRNVITRSPAFGA